MPEEAMRSALRQSSATTAAERADRDDSESPPRRRDDHQATRDRVLASLLSCPDTQTTRANGIGGVTPS